MNFGLAFITLGVVLDLPVSWVSTNMENAGKLEGGVHGTNDLAFSIIKHISGSQSIPVLSFPSCHSECDSDQEQKHVEL